METLLNRISRVTEGIAAIALAAIFITFILQVFARYAATVASASVGATTSPLLQPKTGSNSMGDPK